MKEDKSKEEILEITERYLDFSEDYYESQVATTLEDIYNQIKLYNIFTDDYPICNIIYYVRIDNSRMMRQNFVIDYEKNTKEKVISLLETIQFRHDFKYFLLSKEARNFYMTKRKENE